MGATYNSILRTASFSGISNGPFANRLDYGASPTYRQNLPTSPRFYGHTQPAVNILERFSQVADATRDAEILKSLDNLNISHDNNNINYHQYQHQPVSTANGLPNFSSTSSTYSTQSGPVLSSQAMPQVNHALLSSKSELNSPSIVSGVTYRSSESFNSPYITPSPLYGSSEYLQQKSQDDASKSRSNSLSTIWRSQYGNDEIHHSASRTSLNDQNHNASPQYLQQQQQLHHHMQYPPSHQFYPPPEHDTPMYQGEYADYDAQRMFRASPSPSNGSTAPIRSNSRSSNSGGHLRQQLAYQHHGRFPSRGNSVSTQGGGGGGGFQREVLKSPFEQPLDLHSPPQQPLSIANGRKDKENNSLATIRSPLLEEFRTNKNKKYEISDLFGHVVEFSGDQHGSRFIQQRLESSTSEEKETIFKEIQSNALQLMTDVFGNYVIQKFFELGNQLQKTALAKQMETHILSLSLQMYGCRVVQKAIEHILTDQQATLIKELDGHVLRCVKDQNGNHVIQKAIERIPGKYIGFILDAFRNQVCQLAMHPYGCRVIQRMLEYSDLESQRLLLDEIHSYTFYLVEDQYGNYVIQHVIERGKDEDRQKILTLVKDSILTFSRHKFASNVVEKCIIYGNAKQRQSFIEEIIKPRQQDGTMPVTIMMRDQYANYVVQKLLEITKNRGEMYEQLVASIKPQLQALKKYSYGKHLVSIEKLMQLSGEDMTESDNQS